MIKPIAAALIAAGIIGGGSYGAMEVSTQNDSIDSTSPANFDGQSDTGTDPATPRPSRKLAPSRDTEALPTIAPIVPRDRQPRIIPPPDQRGTTSCYDYEYSNYTDCTGPGGTTSCYDYEYSNYTDCTGPGGTTSCYDYEYSNYTDCTGPGGTTSCYDYEYSNYTDCTGPGGSTTCYEYEYSNYTDCTTH